MQCLLGMKYNARNAFIIDIGIKLLNAWFYVLHLSCQTIKVTCISNI